MRFHHSGPTDGDFPPEVYQLADHLDAALAAAEDLVEAGQQWEPATAIEGYLVAAQMAAERQVIERVRMFETVLIGRVLKARKRAQALAHKAGDFAGMTRLFVGGTAPLVDAVEELGDSTRADFETGDCHLAYLRQRGVIAVDAADLPDDRALSLGDERFLVAGRIALAPLTEMIIAFLDALEAHYDLYPDEPGGDGTLGWNEITGASASDDAAYTSAALDGNALATSTTEAGALVDGVASDAALAAAVTATRTALANEVTPRGGVSATADEAPAQVNSGARPITAKSLIERLGAVAQPAE